MAQELSSKNTLTKLKKIFLGATFILLTASAILAIIAVLISGNELTFKILVTTLLLSLFSLITAPITSCDSVTNKKSSKSPQLRL